MWTLRPHRCQPPGAHLSWDDLDLRPGEKAELDAKTAEAFARARKKVRRADGLRPANRVNWQHLSVTIDGRAAIFGEDFPARWNAVAVEASGLRLGDFAEHEALQLQPLGRARWLRCGWGVAAGSWCSPFGS